MFPEHTEYPPAGTAASMAYKSRHKHQVQLHTKNKNNQIESGHFHKQAQSYVCGLEHFLQPVWCKSFSWPVVAWPIRTGKFVNKFLQKPL